MTTLPEKPGGSSDSSEPYDDSFALGPVPGGDVLYSAPRHVGEEAAPAPTAAETRDPAWPYGPPGQVPSEYRQPDPPPARPGSWGPSQVNLPSSAGPPARRPSWTPSRGHRRKLPPWVLVLGGLWLGGQVFGFFGGIADSIFGNDTESARGGSTGNVSSPATPQRMLEGMSLADSPDLPTRTSIVWRIEAPAAGERTYTVSLNGQVVRTFTTADQVVTSEPYQPGLWSISFPNEGHTSCYITVDSTWVATLTSPGSPETSCLLDTAWLPTS